MAKNMKKSSFLIAGKHAVVEALKNPERIVEKVFLTEESKKNINKENQNLNLLKNVKILYKTKKDTRSSSKANSSKTKENNKKPQLTKENKSREE